MFQPKKGYNPYLGWGKGNDEYNGTGFHIEKGYRIVGVMRLPNIIIQRVQNGLLFRAIFRILYKL